MTQATSLVGVFAGPVNDRGFYESGFRGAEAACRRAGVGFTWRERVGIGAEELAQAAAEAAGRGPTLVLVHGGRSDEAVYAVAPAHPAVRFLSTHGVQAGDNYSCFNIRQPQSAYLAGALAALTTRTGVVAHLSGIRIRPGLHARAAWVQGALDAVPGVRVLTCFCGTQDDDGVSYRHARELLGQGADVLYTMLNAGRTGAIAACRELKASQIGNVIDWCAVHPDVFIGSAVADNGRLVGRWVEDVAAGRLRQGEVRWLGIEDPQAVRLVVAGRVPADVRLRLDALAASLGRGEIELATEFAGTEFPALEDRAGA